MLEPEQIWIQLSQRAQTDGENSISAHELAIFRASYFLFQLECGGLSGFLYNKSPAENIDGNWAELSECIQALNTIGSVEGVKLLEKVQKIVQSQTASSVDTWDEFLKTVDSRNKLPEIDNHLCDMIYPMYDDLKLFTVTSCS